MKKITLLAIAALTISLASCKKDRVCECTMDTTSVRASTPVSGGITVTTTNNYTSSSKTTYSKIKKGDAKYACQNTTDEEKYTTYSSGGSTKTDVTNTTKSDCKIK